MTVSVYCSYRLLKGIRAYSRKELRIGTNTVECNLEKKSKTHNWVISCEIQLKN